MDILVTGHKGYIGSNLYSQLNDKYNLRGLASIESILNLKIKPKADYVIHLASKFNISDSIKYPTECFQKNILASKKLFELYPDVPIIFSSSSTVNNLKTPYSQVKFAIELIAPKNVTILRLFSVYGGINYRKDMIYGLAKENKLLFVNTKIKRDYIHVDEVIKTIDYLINNPKPGKTFDVGTGNSITVTDFFKRIKYDYKHLPKKNYVSLTDDVETCARKEHMLFI